MKTIRKNLKVISAIVIALLLIIVLLNFNTIIDLPQSFRCRDIVNEIEDIGAEVDRVRYSKEEDCISIKVEAISLSCMDLARQRVNEYLEKNEDFYYRSSGFVLSYLEGDECIEVSKSEYSGKLSRYVINIEYIDIGDLGELYDVTELYSSEIEINAESDFTFFENNPQLKYCKLRCDNPEEAEKKIKSLCPDCVVEWM